MALTARGNERRTRVHLRSSDLGWGRHTSTSTDVLNEFLLGAEENLISLLLLLPCYGLDAFFVGENLCCTIRFLVRDLGLTLEGSRLHTRTAW